MTRLTLMLLPVFAMGAVAVARGVAPPPNIVLILADDLGWAQSGFEDDSYYETPRLHALRREGLLFTSAYAAAPVCSPTRAALLTGLSPARLRLTDFLPPSAPADRVLRPAPMVDSLALGSVTLAARLGARGYRTALFGKWHLARGYFPPESEHHPPSVFGFDDFLITHKPDDRTDPERDAHNTARITDRALGFIDAHRARPFFLKLAYNAPHTPLMERRERIAYFRSKPGADRPGNNPVLAAMIATLDEAIGRVFDRLAEHGLSGQTAVFFYSDNGGLRRVAAQSPLRGGKSQLYEGGIRVPLVVRWPGVVAPGGTTGALVSAEDVSATILDVAGVHAEEPLDGVAFTSVLRGEPLLPRGPLFWHYPHYHSEGGEPSSAVRRGDWKLIEFHEHTLTGRGPEPQLFQLADDPGETVSLASRQPAIAAELLAELRAWRRRVDAAMPTVRLYPPPASAAPSAR